MRIKAFLVSILFLMLTVNIYAQNRHVLDDSNQSGWRLIIVDSNTVSVVWQFNNDNEKTVNNAVGVWENATEYLVTFKDGSGIILRKQNIDFIRFKKNKIAKG